MMYFLQIYMHFALKTDFSDIFGALKKEEL